MPTVVEAFRQAVALHEAGQLNQAEQIYRQILQVEPRHAQVLHLLGIVALQVNRHDMAIEYIGQAISNGLVDAACWSNLGSAYAATGRFAEAAAAFDQALQIDPTFGEARLNFGIALEQQGRLADAAEQLAEAARLRPQQVEAHLRLANVLGTLGKPAEAEALYRRVLALAPQRVEARNNLANMLRDQGKVAEAIAELRETLRLAPEFAPGHYNLGNALRESGQIAAAQEHYRRALELQPDFVEARINLANLLNESQRPQEALVEMRRVAETHPKSPAAHYNLGNVLKDLGRLDEAEASFRTSLAIHPDFVESYNNLAIMLTDQGRLEEAATCLQRAAQLRPQLSQPHSNLLFLSNYLPGISAEAALAEHLRWGERHRGAAENVTHPNSREPERRLRIGYVSGDFRKHALPRFFEPILAHHDPRDVEVICYANHFHADATTARMQSHAHGWRFIRDLSDDQVEALIRRDQIDILVDLSGHTAGNRLAVFARKPAPVQATYLGYPNTTGLTAVDYRLTDAVLNPPGEPYDGPEQLVRLPRGVCCFAPIDDAPPVGPLPAAQAGQLTFGSLHKLSKLNAGVFDLWRGVLEAVPNARLLMLRDTLIGRTKDQILSEFTRRGIDGERLDLRHDAGPGGHLAAFQEIDILLDTFPYGGGTISYESAWMGVPVLVLSGDRPAARGGATLLASLGLADWIAESPDDYVAKAEAHARDLPALAALRGSLRERLRATLCDCAAFTRTLEQAYRDMWRTWCAKP